ncbi:TonB-dependent receptor plug domain-containing protein [Sphingobacterium phlebotomi]|uniref:TonB-dependent receptor plug domain-containing protein n=1 Tax=Sphingobacterium phlebotomi TaxID=2605433 RepID=A0A5D4H5C9_9SPHI|nr:TonB-dependent receptor [Sphingobacterium phlebotomi]TYR36261.1 TonB-dependent receptor plug domain-containing protein [Sphingobacterium phlebotomi]
MQFNLYYFHFIMRIFMLSVISILCLTEVLLASGANAQLLQKKVTLEIYEGSIADAVKNLESKNVLIAYDAAKYNLNNRKVVSGRFRNTPVKDILNHIFRSTDMTFRETGSYIILEKKIPQRPGRISGTVYDERGLPLIGANVRVIGNKSAQTSVDGTYNMELPAGTYVVEISYLSYKTRRIQEVKVEAGERTALDIAMQVSNQQIDDVVVTSTFKRSSVAGLYAAQKNAASVTDGISAEQIARTPDNDMGAALKRITGLTTVNNRNVIVRGMSDRYNQAMLDGVSIPSTSMNRRDFSFDIIPTEMVSSVVVNKTATPDVSSEFSGGQVSVNTLDIPDENFTSIQIGSGINSQAIGKDFYRLGDRKNAEYFGFFDKSAKLPEGMLSWQFQRNIEVPPPGNDQTDFDLIPGNGIPYSSLDAVAQSKRLSAEPLQMHRYNGQPNQNYRLSLGRVYELKNGMRFGFSAAASLRNEQQVWEFNNVRGSNYGNAVHYIDSTKIGQNGAGMSYRFNSNSGFAANLGLQGDKFKVTLKNMYARTYSNHYNEAIRLNYADVSLGPNKEQYQLPEAMSLLQHQLSGEYELPWAIKATGMVAYNKISQRILDERKFKYRLTTQIGDDYYFQTPNVRDPSQSGGDNLLEDSRMWTEVNEDDFHWAASFAKSFGTGETLSTLIKLGYQGFDKQRDLSVFRMIPYSARGSNIEQPYEVILDPANIGSGVNEAYYWAKNINGRVFDGHMKMHGVYVMADQKLRNRLRLVYGVRGESFDLNNSQEEILNRQYTDPSEFILFRRGVAESGWRWLPSINATYEVTSTFNVRSSYSRTVIRPDFRESSFFGFYDYELEGNVAGDRVESTVVDNVDLRLELYPGAGEIVSLTGYYKFLDRPIELIRDGSLRQGNYYVLTNMESATNLGLELEVRKNMGFLGEQDWLEDIFVYGNGTLLKSNVKVMTPWGSYPAEGGGSEWRQERQGSQDRPLIGQSPWLLNLGLGYWGESFGLTASYNQRGYRTNLTAFTPNEVEYEKVPGQLDGQLYARILKKRMEIKFNMANLLNDWAIFYANTEAFNIEGGGISGELQKGDLRYNKEDNDTILYRRKEGSRFSLSLTYSF